MKSSQEKETKHFFRNERNMLNKGHLDRDRDENRPDIKMNMRVDRVLPPIEVISEYEDMYPGTLEKALKIAEKEQEYRHFVTKKTLRINSSARIMGQLFGFLSLSAICFVVVRLAMMKLVQQAIYIAAMYMISVVLISIFSIYWDKALYNKHSRNNKYKHKGEVSSKKTNSL